MAEFNDSQIVELGTGRGVDRERGTKTRVGNDSVLLSLLDDNG